MPPTNGYFIKAKDIYTVGDEIIVRCNNGYASESEGRMTCQFNGTWSGVPANCKGTPTVPLPMYVRMYVHKIYLKLRIYIIYT